MTEKATKGDPMLSAKNLLIIGTSLMAMSAQAVVCEVDMVRGNGNLIQPFQSQGFDKREACKEAQKACRLDLRQRQRAGRNMQASCQLVGVIDQGPGPGPGPIPNPNPGPMPPMGNYDYQLDGIQQVLSSGGWRARQHAVQDLVRYPSARAIAMAVKALNDNDGDVRISAQRSLNELINIVDMSYESIEVIQTVTPLLTSGSWRQRQAAAKTLGSVMSAEAIIPLVSAMNDNDGDVRNEAQKGINKLMNESDLKRVVRKNKQAFATLTNSGGWRQRLNAVKVLGAAKVPRTIAIVVKAVGDNDGDVRNTAVKAIKSITNAQNYPNVNMRVIDELSQLSRSGGWRVRMQAVNALGKTFNPAARPAVLRALDDNDGDVRNAARRALNNI